VDPKDPGGSPSILVDPQRILVDPQRILVDPGGFWGAIMDPGLTLIGFFGSILANKGLRIHYTMYRVFDNEGSKV
jgi:hypothetical protein